MARFVKKRICSRRNKKCDLSKHYYITGHRHGDPEPNKKYAYIIHNKHDGKCETNELNHRFSLGIGCVNNEFKKIKYNK
jgi:hypothetical protein